MRLRAVWLFVVPFFWFANPTVPLLVAGGAVTLLGLAIRGWSAGQLQKNRELTVSGPYAHTRNPLYLGSFAIGLGVTVASAQPLFVILFLAFFAWIYRKTMVHEDGSLEERFGEAYRRYRASVPLLVPRLKPFRPPLELDVTVTRWSLDRYVRNKEYEAALGAVASFALLAWKAVR